MNNGGDCWIMRFTVDVDIDDMLEQLILMRQCVEIMNDYDDSSFYQMICRAIDTYEDSITGVIESNININDVLDSYKLGKALIESIKKVKSKKQKQKKTKKSAGK